MTKQHNRELVILVILAVCFIAFFQTNQISGKAVGDLPQALEIDEVETGVYVKQPDGSLIWVDEVGKGPRDILKDLFE